MNNHDSTPNWILLIPAFLLAALFILAGAIPLNSLWGFNHLRYFPPVSLAAFSILFLLILIPPLAGKLYDGFTKLVSGFKKLPRFMQVAFVIVFSGIIFYILRVHVHSLGDGYQRIYQIERGYLYYHTEPLDYFLHSLLFRFLKLLGLTSGEWTYVIYSMIAGIVFTSVIYVFGFPERRSEKFGGFLKLLLLTFGGSQLFFGYVESYSSFYIFSLLYLLFSTRFLIEKKGFLIPSILLGLSAASHITAIFFIPSFFYLIFYNFKYCTPRNFSERFLPPAVGIIPFLGLLGQEIWIRTQTGEYISGISEGFLPLFSPSGYSILSPPHLLDVLNEILLVSPIIAIFVVWLIFPRKSFSGAEKLHNFAWLAGGFSFVLLLVIDPKLGYVRDWDLFSTAAASVGMAILLLSLSQINDFRLPNQMKVMIGALAIIFLSVWIFTNASRDRQLDRAEDLLSLSDKGRGYSTELLAYYYENRVGDARKSLELLRGITGSAKNARVFNKIANSEFDLGLYEDAMKSIDSGLRLDSNYAALHLTAGMTLAKMGKPDSGLPHLLKTAELEPARYEVFLALGDTYFRLDSKERAISAFREAIRINPQGAVTVPYFEIGNIFRLLGKYDSAYVYVRNGLRRNPNFPHGIELLDLIKQEATSKMNPK